MSYRNQLRDIKIPEKQVFCGNVFSFVLLFICPVAVLLNRTANKGDDQQMFLVNGAESQAKQRNRLKMAALVQSGARAPNRQQFSLNMEVFPDLHLTSNLELKIESCALQVSFKQGVFV